MSARPLLVILMFQFFDMIWIKASYFIDVYNFQANEMQVAMDLVLAVSRLIEVTAPYSAQFKEGSPVSHFYRFIEYGVSY